MRAAAGAQLAGNHWQTPLLKWGFGGGIPFFGPSLFLNRNLAGERLKIGWQGGMENASIRQVGVCIGDGCRGVRGGLHVVSAVHDQQVAGGRVGSQGGLRLGKLGGELGGVSGRQAGAVAVTVTQESHQHPRAIWGLPPKLARPVIHPAPQGGRLDAEAAQDLGNLPRVAEGVWDVADLHFGAKAAGRARPLQEVADMGLRADQEHVGQDVPGADQDAAALHVLAQDGFLFGAHVQVIIEDDGLPIEHEVLEAGVFFQPLQQAIHQVDELEAELLEGLVPLAVPMGVRNDVQGVHHSLTFSAVNSCASRMAAGRMLIGKRLCNGLRRAPRPVAFQINQASGRVKPVRATAWCSSSRVSVSQPPARP